MIYDEYLTTAEMQRWILSADVAWNQIDRDIAREDEEMLDRIRDSALIESYFPIYTTNLIRHFWDQLDVTSVFSIQLYESYKHFYVLNRYLTIVDYRPIKDEELVQVRQKNLDNQVTDSVAELTRYMISEHFAAYFFLRTSRLSKEPVLGQICGFIARDEFRHTQFAFELLEPRLRQTEDARLRCLNAGIHFRHVGCDVVSTVPISEKNDLQAILTLDQKMHRLCGVALSEFAKAGMNVT